MGVLSLSVLSVSSSCRLLVRLVISSGVLSSSVLSTLSHVAGHVGVRCCGLVITTWITGVVSESVSVDCESSSVCIDCESIT